MSSLHYNSVDPEAPSTQTMYMLLEIAAGASGGIQASNNIKSCSGKRSLVYPAHTGAGNMLTEEGLQARCSRVGLPPKRSRGEGGGGESRKLLVLSRGNHGAFGSMEALHACHPGSTA